MCNIRITNNDLTIMRRYIHALYECGKFNTLHCENGENFKSLQEEKLYSAENLKYFIYLGTEKFVDYKRNNTSLTEQQLPFFANELMWEAGEGSGYESTLKLVQQQFKFDNVYSCEYICEHRHTHTITLPYEVTDSMYVHLEHCSQRLQSIHDKLLNEQRHIVSLLFFFTLGIKVNSYKLHNTAKL